MPFFFYYIRFSPHCTVIIHDLGHYKNINDSDDDDKIIILEVLNDNNNNNKVGMQFPYILVWKLHTQACEIMVGTKRKLCKKFQVDICKTKKDRPAQAQLRQAIIYNAARVRMLSTKLQVDSDACKTKEKR